MIKPKPRRLRLHELGDYYREIGKFGGIAKPEPRQKARARERRAEKPAMDVAYQHADGRDGYCRLYWSDAKTREQAWGLFGKCRGRSTLAHYNETHRRSKTRGRPPDERHQGQHAMKLCERHHSDYDQHRFEIEEMTEAGCDGRLRVRRAADGATFEEPE